MGNLPSLIEAIGLLGVFLIVFAESGLLIGFFLPGDSLLFVAGFLASQGYFNIWLLAAVCLLGAVLGDSVGYAIGKKMGPRLFRREDSLLFHKDNLNRAKTFYDRHGGLTIVLARFLPVIRTFAPILAGVGRMRYPLFFFYNIIGGILWALGLTSLGFVLGNTVEDVDRYIIPVILGIIAVSIIPPAVHFLRKKENRRELGKFIRRFVEN